MFYYISTDSPVALWGFYGNFLNNDMKQGTQNKKEYSYNQSHARTSAMLSEMGQAEKERRESHEWALMFMLPV